VSSYDALAQAHEALRQSVPSQRRQAHKAEGQLAATFREAMRIWDLQKAEGMSLADRVAGLERTLRVAWPFTREWKFLCEACNDRGLVMAMCPGDATCGRHREHQAHEYGSPCWCSVGNRFKAKAPSEDDYTAAAKTKPAGKGFSKWGR
jgi:hypothetical protein